MDVRRKKRNFFKRKEVIVVIFAIALTTGGIKAADTFLNKNSDEQSRCPKDMTTISSTKGEFCIDKFEVSTGPSCPVVSPINQEETRKNLEVIDCKPVSISGAVPWTNISQDQAELACAKAGKRLPSSQEWYEAALGTPDPSQNWTQDDCQVNRNWDNQPGRTGSGKNCISGMGAYDMVGNVWEWVKGVSEDGKIEGKELPKSGYIDSSDGGNLPGSTNPDRPNENYNNDYFWIKSSGLRAVARGGYWDNKSDAGQYSVYMVLAPSMIGSGVGFRCVK